MDELDIAVHQTAKEFGFQPLAEKMGKREQTLRNKCNPADDSAVLTLREAVAMVVNTGDSRIAHAFARKCGGEFHAETHSPRGVVLDFLDSQRQSADVTRAVTDALADDHVSLREAASITKEIEEAIASLQQLQRSVQTAADQRLRVAS